MKKYAVELGDELGQVLTKLADKRGFTLSALVRSILWQYLDQNKSKKRAK